MNIHVVADWAALFGVVVGLMFLIGIAFDINSIARIVRKGRR